MEETKASIHVIFIYSSVTFILFESDASFQIFLLDLPVI